MHSLLLPHQGEVRPCNLYDVGKFGGLETCRNLLLPMVQPGLGFFTHHPESTREDSRDPKRQVAAKSGKVVRDRSELELGRASWPRHSRHLAGLQSDLIPRSDIFYHSHFLEENEILGV